MNKDIIWKAQMAALREMEVNLVSLIKSAQETQSRIQTDGLSHNYSENHDCYGYAVKVWKQSLRLAELKKLEYDVTGLDTWGMSKKDKHNKGGKDG
jgi:hypothetical protein